MSITDHSVDPVSPAGPPSHAAPGLLTKQERFAAQDFVQHLRDQPRWTISDAGKKPLDMRALMTTGIPRGAVHRDERCLVTLDELLEIAPNAVNYAFFLRVDIDELMVLDIEKTARPGYRDQLLTLPSHYTETSMSGLGYHLVMDPPTNLAAFPDAAGKKRLQHSSREFELIFEHFITFTMQEIHPQTIGTAAPGSVESLYSKLAQDVKPDIAWHLDPSESPEDIPYFEQLVNALVRTPFKRTPADYDGDLSRFEFAAAEHAYRNLQHQRVSYEVLMQASYTPADMAQIVYAATTRMVPHRDKHDSIRNGRPLLLENALKIVAIRSTPSTS